jgi:predicted phosphohydrolase
MKKIVIFSLLLIFFALFGCVIPQDTPKDSNTFFNTPQNTQSDLNTFFTFAAYGDSRCCGNSGENKNHVQEAKLVDFIITKKPNFVLQVGDIVQYADDLNEWAQVREIEAKFQPNIDFWPTMGNHDYVRKDKGTDKNYYNNFFDLEEANKNYVNYSGGGLGGQEWYSFDYNNSHFISIDSYSIATKDEEVTREQKDWLEADLNKTKKDFVFILTHYPLCGNAMHGDTPELWSYGYADLIKKYNVSAVIAGHEHVYERFTIKYTSIPLIVTGMGGGGTHSKTSESTRCITEKFFGKESNIGLEAVTFAISQDSAKITAYSVDNKVLDELVIQKRN